MAVGMTKEQSNMVAMGGFTIAALAMDKAQGHVGESLPTRSREKNCLELLLAVAQTPTLVAAIGTTKEQSYAAIDMAWGLGAR
jgi:hypothetical protein